MEHPASLSFARLLVNLRWLSVAGQALTILVVTRPLGVALPETPLWAGVGALALFNLFAARRVRTAGDVSVPEVFAHILVDIVALTWMVAWSGGIE
ncbi:MAG TPA: hypothetical protein PKL49_07500, partial [Steroidobacteraceae bacterium]|nr:hypothetical protein [Steroidobacteraceae bacterium]